MDSVSLLLHHSGVNGAQVGEDRVAVEDVEVIPAALGGKLLQVQPDCGVFLGGLDEPRALGVHRVVAEGVGQPALGAVQLDLAAAQVALVAPPPGVAVAQPWRVFNSRISDLELRFGISIFNPF